MGVMFKKVVIKHKETIQNLASQSLEHEVYLNLEPYLVDFWLNENVGIEWDPVNSRSGNWAVFWLGRFELPKYVYLFAEKNDAVWFTLRWA
jgi:hypothetical protein